MLEIVVTEQDFDVSQEYESLRSYALQAGAIVFFVGLVRDFYAQDDPQQDKIDAIELHHYPGMTERLCEKILQQANDRWNIQAAKVIHRVGRIASHEQIVMVSVASQHRADAFAAAEFIMDYLKTRATFWKKESGSRGNNWVLQKRGDLEAAKRWQVTTKESVEQDE